MHPVPHPPLLSSNLENKVESSRQNISSRGTNTQVPSSPVRSAGIPPAPVGGYSEQYLPTASNTVLSPGNPRSFIPTRDCQNTNTGSTIAGERANDVTPIVIPRLKLVVNEPQEDSTNASKSPKDVTPIAVPRLKLVVNEPREDSTNAKESPKDVTPIATPRLKLFFKPKSRQPILDSIPSTVPSDPASSEHLSSPTNPGNRSSNMSPPKPSAESTSYESSSDYEASTSINATSDLPATSESPKPSSSSDEAPSRDAGHLSPLNFVPTPAMNPSLDPSMDPSMGPYMDPYQPTDSAVMPGISPFEDPNVRPSTFIFPEETPDYSSVPIDPMGVYTPEQYARILASEEEVLREMADMHTDTPTYMYDRRVEQNYTTVADLDRIFAEMEAASDGIDILQPEYWAAIGRDLPGPSSQSGVLESNQPAHAQPASETLQSVEEAEPGSAKKRARYSSPKAKSSTPELSSTISARTSVSDQRRSTSSRTKTVSPPPASIQTCRHSKNQAATPPAQTSTSSRRRSKNKAKSEVDTPEVPVSVSPRRLRSSGVMPTSSAKKNPKGNATPESWETAPTADKMMSQMKESSMPWMDITAAWNENRNESDDEMTWRALSKRWGRIRERIGPWPGFDVCVYLTF